MWGWELINNDPHHRGIGYRRLMHRSNLRELFDDLVGAGEKRWWHTEAKRPSDLQIHGQVKFGRDALQVNWRASRPSELSR